MIVLQKDCAAVEGWCCRRVVLQKDGAAVQEDGAVVEGWCCSRRMVLQKDGAAEGWCCTRVLL